MRKSISQLTGLGPFQCPSESRVPRVRTVVRGERASRSIVNRTMGLWSIWMVSSLILAGLCLVAVFEQSVVAKLLFRAALTECLT